MDVNTLEKKRIQILTKLIIFFLIAIILFPASIYLFSIKIIGVITKVLSVFIYIALIINWVNISDDCDEFETIVKRTFLPTILDKLTQGEGKITWKSTSSFNQLYKKKKDNETIDLFDSLWVPNERFEGTYKNVKFSVTEYNEVKRSKRYSYTIFRGHIIKFPTEIKYPGKLVIGNKKITLQAWTLMLFKNIQKLKTNPQNFLNRSLYTSNPDMLDKILTPEFTTFVNNLPKSAYIAFAENNLYVLYSTNRDTFKMGSIFKKIDNLNQDKKFTTDLVKVLNIIEKAKPITYRTKEEEE